MNIHVINKLQNATFFNGLNEDQLKQVCNKSKLLSFEKEDIIFYQGDTAKGFYLIIQGWVTIVKENKNAEQSVLHVFKAGESFAEPAALILGHYPASAYAASSCELLEIKLSVLQNMIKDDVNIAMRIIARLSSQLNILVNEFEQYKTMSVPKRLAIFLLELSENNPNQYSVDLPFNKSILAAYLGVQPGTLSRAFNQLTNHGVKTDRSGHIVFEDINSLRAFIENPT